MIAIQESHETFPTLVSDIGFDVAFDAQSSLNRVNESIRKRKANDRDTIMQALKAGRELVALKRNVVYGSWEEWIVTYTDYESARYAQNDMQFWLHWERHIDDLVRVGLIHHIDTPEAELVQSLDDKDVQISISAMSAFMRKGVPDTALDLVLEALDRGDEPVTIKGAHNIIEAAREIEKLPPEHRDAAKMLFHQHGVDNPQVLSRIPEMAQQPEVLEEALKSGHMFVPGLDDGAGRQVPVAQLGRTDIDMSLGRAAMEHEYQQQTQYKQRAEFETIVQLEGTVEQIRHALAQVKFDDACVYRVFLSSRKPNETF